MVPYIILAILVFIVLSIIIFEVRNEKKYQESRRQERNKKPKTTPRKTSAPKPTKTETTTVPLHKEETLAPLENIKIEEAVKEEPTTPPAKVLPQCQYPTFNHDRLIDMGLSNDEAKEFVGELISQIDEHIIQINDATHNSDTKKLEQLTHTIKGSASNLGTGGITDLLAEFNTYLREGTDMDVIKTYANALIEYTTKLKAQYA